LQLVLCESAMTRTGILSQSWTWNIGSHALEPEPPFVDTVLAVPEPEGVEKLRFRSYEPKLLALLFCTQKFSCFIENAIS
jgi:hypothetical protein